jgi:Heat induced stress protein YflT
VQQEGFDMQTRDLAVAVFDDRDDAERAINGLRDAGFEPDQISVMARDRDEAGRLAEDTGTEAGTGAATGALTGGLLGGVAGWLIGIGALAIPGVGPIIAAGPLAAALGGAALGAAGGGLIGALTGAGVPEEEARYYEDRFKTGGILLTVNAPGRYDEAADVLRDHGGHDYEGTMGRSDVDRGTSERRDRDKDDDETRNVVGGSAAGGTVGGVTGAAIGGPAGLAAGAAIGGTAGAMAGDASVETEEEEEAERRRRERTVDDRPLT